MAFNFFKRKNNSSRQLSENEAGKVQYVVEKVGRKYSPYKEAEAIKSSYRKEQEYNQNKQEIRFLKNQQSYNQSRTGRLGNFIAKGFALGKKGGVSRALYQRSGQLPQVSMSSIDNRYKNRQTFRANSGGARGRPFGTKDVRYAKYGGVFGYRKYLAQQNKLQRLDALRRATINPQQQQILREIEMRDQLNKRSPESQVIPDTRGQVFLAGIMDEADRASHILD